MRRDRKTLGAILAMAAVLAGAVLLAWPSPQAGTELVVVVPEGTRARIDAGEPVELLPRLLEVRVGDSLVIINQDDATHQVGPYIVGPQQRLEQRFTIPGRIDGICTLHPSGQVAIVVR